MNILKYFKKKQITKEIKEKFGQLYISHKIDCDKIEVVIKDKFANKTSKYRGSLSDLKYKTGLIYVAGEVFFTNDSRLK